MFNLRDFFFEMWSDNYIFISLLWFVNTYISCLCYPDYKANIKTECDVANGNLVLITMSGKGQSHISLSAILNNSLFIYKDILSYP